MTAPGSYDPAAVLARLVAGERLDRDETADFLDGFVQGMVSPIKLAAFMTALRVRGETAAEVAGTALAIRRHMTPIRSSHPDGVLDTCGTGGDGSGTFNISTAAALLAAAAGVPTAKHGNRKVTSRSGSADVLTELGVDIEAPLATVERCLAEVGLTFCFAPLWHPALKLAADIRRDLGFPTVLNLVGPLANPAGAAFQVIGVGRRELRPKLAEALRLLGSRRALVVWGSGLDEVALHGPTEVSYLHDDTIDDLRWEPADFGLAEAPLSALAADGPRESAARIRAILAGELGPGRDIVVANAAAGVWLAGREATLPAAAARCAAALDSGAAARLLDVLARCSRTGGGVS